MKKTIAILLSALLCAGLLASCAEETAVPGTSSTAGMQESSAGVSVEPAGSTESPFDSSSEAVSSSTAPSSEADPEPEFPPEQLRFTLLHNPNISLDAPEEEFVQAEKLEGYEITPGRMMYIQESAPVLGLDCVVTYFFQDGRIDFLSYATTISNYGKQADKGIQAYQHMVSFLTEVYGPPESQEDQKSVWGVMSDAGNAYQISAKLQNQGGSYVIFVEFIPA